MSARILKAMVAPFYQVPAGGALSLRREEGAAPGHRFVAHGRMADDRGKEYDRVRPIWLSEGMAMTSGPSAPDSHASHSREGEASGSPSAATGPPTAGESQPLPWPYRDVDPWTGRLRPISEEEMQARYEQYKRELAEIDAQDDTPEEVYDEVMRNLEALHSHEGRPSEQPLSTTGPCYAGESPFAEWPYRDVDPRTGRLRPISDEEMQARYEQYKKRLAEIDAEDDTPDEVYDQFMRNIDEERRRQGRPPAFEGCY
jgi:hypothetical protein